MVVKKMKLASIRIASDGCKVVQGRVVADGVIKIEGTPVAMHEGEWVEIVPVMTLREMLSLQRLQKSIKENESKDFTALCVELSKRVTAWNWTEIPTLLIPLSSMASMQATKALRMSSLPPVTGSMSRITILHSPSRLFED